MQTECNPDLFGFARVEGRAVVAAFDGGTITSDAGALLLEQTDKAIRLINRLAGCFADARRPELIEHKVKTLNTAPRRGRKVRRYWSFLRPAVLHLPRR